MAPQLEPLLGPRRGSCSDRGTPAGITTAITAPLAAAYATAGALGWQGGLR